jgi:large subunit ribosomal protein L29
LELDDIRQMNPEDLRVKERETREEIFRLRLKMRTNQLDNPSGYRRARRELARILTVLRSKDSGGSPSAAAKGPDAAAS